MAHILRRRRVAGARDADTNIIRGLGLHESYQLAIQTLNQYRGTAVACRYCPPSSLTSPESIESLKARFHDAIAHVVLAQPHMQLGVIGEYSKKHAFVRLDRLNLRNHVEWKTLDGSSNYEAQCLETMQSKIDARFSHLSTQPGWSVTVLHEVGSDCIEVIYVWSHTHHDGMSGKMFHQQLLRNLNSKVDLNKRPVNNAQEGSDQWIIDLPDSSDKLPPPPEVLCAFPTTVPWLVKSLWKELKPPAIFSPDDTSATWAPVKTSPYKTRFRTFTIGDDILTKVVDACRQHHTTVTGLLHALVFLSLSSGLGDAKGFASRTPYNLRPILPSHTRKYPWLEPKDAMCNYVSVVDHEFDAGLVAKVRAQLATARTGEEVSAAAPAPAARILSADLMDVVWSVAARVRREIKARLDSGVRNDLIGIMKFIRDWKALQESETRKPRQLSWLVTNIGVFDGRGGIDIDKEEHEEEDAWSVRRAELVLSAEVTSAAISVSVITVKGEQMTVTCSWQDCVVDAGLGKRLVDNLEGWLKEIGSTG